MYQVPDQLVQLVLQASEAARGTLEQDVILSGRAYSWVSDCSTEFHRTYDCKIMVAQLNPWATFDAGGGDKTCTKAWEAVSQIRSCDYELDSSPRSLSSRCFTWSTTTLPATSQNHLRQAS